MASYQLGNDLRGWFSGEFEDDAAAWEALSDLFNKRFPSRDGRSIQLRKIIRSGKTAGGNETQQDKEIREALEARIAADKETHP